MRRRVVDQADDDLPEEVTALPERSSADLTLDQNPFNDPDWRMTAYAWSGFMLRVLLIAGGIFTVIQYIQTRDETRIERSLELVELWEQPEYQLAQKALKTRLLDLNAQYSGLLDDNASAAEKSVYDERIGLAALTAEGGEMPVGEFRDHFDRIVYFLNRVAFCVQENLCKPSVADAYFHDFAASFWAYFAGHVREERQGGSPNYAVTIESYIQRER